MSKLTNSIRGCMRYIWNGNNSISEFIEKCCEKYSNVKSYIDELIRITSFDVSSKCNPKLERIELNETLDDVLRQIFQYKNIVQPYNDGLMRTLTDDEIYYYIILFKIQERIRNKVQDDERIKEYVSNVYSLYFQLKEFKFMTTTLGPYDNTLSVNKAAFRVQYKFVKQQCFKRITELNEKMKIKYDSSLTEDLYIDLTHPEWIFGHTCDLIMDDIIEILKSDAYEIHAVDIIKILNDWEKKERQKPDGIFSDDITSGNKQYLYLIRIEENDSKKTGYERLEYFIIGEAKSMEDVYTKCEKTYPEFAIKNKYSITLTNTDKDEINTYLNKLCKVCENHKKEMQEFDNNDFLRYQISLSKKYCNAGITFDLIEAFNDIKKQNE